MKKPKIPFKTRRKVLADLTHEWENVLSDHDRLEYTKIGSPNWTGFNVFLKFELRSKSRL